VKGEPGQTSGEHHVSRTRRDGALLLRVAWPRTVATRHAGPRARRAHPGSLRALRRDLRQSEHPSRAGRTA
jgi:hypothetical protein